MDAGWVAGSGVREIAWECEVASESGWEWLVVGWEIVVVVESWVDGV